MKRNTNQPQIFSSPPFGVLITHSSPPIERQDNEEEYVNFDGRLSADPKLFTLKTSSSSLSSSNQKGEPTSNSSNEVSSEPSTDEIPEGSYLNHLDSIQARDESKNRRSRRRRPRSPSKKSGTTRNRLSNQSTPSRKKN